MEHGCHKTPYNHYSAGGILAEMLVYLAAHHGEVKPAMIGATHRTVSSLAIQKAEVAVQM